MNPYQFVENQMNRYSNLQHLSAVASWDEAVMMPTGGGEARAQAISELQVLMVEILQSRQFGDAIEQANGLPDLSPWQRANLREALNEHKKAVAIDPKLVAQMSEERMQSEQAWRKFRGQNNWADYKPYLKKVVASARIEAAQRAQSSGLGRYDAMVDLWQPDIRSSQIENLFLELKTVLPDFISKVIENQSRKSPIDLGRSIDDRDLTPAMQELMRWIGFDFNRGRLDKSHHPFCSGGNNDVRITSRLGEKNFWRTAMGVLHETGHARYEQGLPQDWLKQPVGRARGMAVHESQSLFVEMQISRSLEFLEYVNKTFFQKLKKPGDPTGFWDTENLYRMATQVSRGFIRVDADELTYPLHIVLRFELEKALIEGQIEIEDLPHLWNEGMQKYLGLSTQGRDNDGCMQDVHWPAGLFGYFPSYTLGALLAAQLFQAADLTVRSSGQQEVRSEIRKGNIQVVFNFLAEKIWSQASFLSTNDLILQATGSKLQTKDYFLHIERRYEARLSRS